jgi:hypothetical protein
LAQICRILSKSIPIAISTGQIEALKIQLNKSNEYFQLYLEKNFKQAINSSAVKKPQIVSRILEYLNFNYRNEKIALIVVDGLSFWQYELFANRISGIMKSARYFFLASFHYSIIPPGYIQRGKPLVKYKQNPANESKLWTSFWKEKGVDESQISYMFDKIDFDNIITITKLAVVYKDLDGHMHHSPDYKMLLGLTKDWIERSQIISVIENLRQARF